MLHPRILRTLSHLDYRGNLGPACLIRFQSLQCSLTHHRNVYKLFLWCTLSGDRRGAILQNGGKKGLRNVFVKVLFASRQAYQIDGMFCFSARQEYWDILVSITHASNKIKMINVNNLCNLEKNHQVGCSPRRLICVHHHWKPKTDSIFEFISGIWMNESTLKFFFRHTSQLIR